jgi:beta-galactosidase
LVRYKIGEGGAVLVNLLFKSQEDVPENAGKKLAILSTILHNLNAPFAGGRTIVPGAKNVQYQTVDISKKANQFTNDRGWFGQPDRTFGDLPTGRQVFAGVPFNVFEFLTSPVPTAIMLGGPGIPGNLPDAVTGIPVGTKAEALFFLQAARIDQARNSDEVRDHKHVEVGEYVIHYSDGQSAVVPIEMGENVDSYLQSHPSPLPGAQIGWQHRFAGSDQSAVAYVQQWNNPRPEAPIESIDLRYGKDRRGVPALLAITAAK